MAGSGDGPSAATHGGHSPQRQLEKCQALCALKKPFDTKAQPQLWSHAPSCVPLEDYERLMMFVSNTRPLGQEKLEVGHYIVGMAEAVLILGSWSRPEVCAPQQSQRSGCSHIEALRVHCSIDQHNHWKPVAVAAQHVNHMRHA